MPAPSITPVILDVLTLYGEEHDLALAGDYAYLVNPGGHFSACNISDPANLTLAGHLQDATNFVSGDATQVVGNVCFALTREGRLSAINISTPGSPVRISTLVDGTNLAGAADLEIVGDYAFIAATDANALAVVDVSDTSAMTYVTSLTHATALKTPSSVWADGTVLYVGCEGGGGGSGLASVNIATPTTPVLLDFNAPGAACSAVHIRDGIAYTINSGPANRVDTFDVSDPADITHLDSLVDALIDRPLGIWAEDGVATIPCQTDVGVVAYVDVSDPAALAYITRVEQEEPGGDPPGDFGTAELYHAFRCVRRDGIDYIAVAGSGRLTTIDLQMVAPTLSIPGLFVIDGVPALVVAP